ncbi:MAG TPA: hypothetical protein VNC22_23175 [Sporichthya sp.]|nr:hypothetical protein [Sporichthya sp.]
MILATAIAWGTTDILFFGARPIVMSTALAMFFSPAALRFDEARRLLKGMPPRSEDKPKEDE